MYFQSAKNREQLSSVCWRNSLILDCHKDVQGVIEENSGVEGARKATPQADPGNACLYSYQARESNKAGGQRSIARYSKQDKTDFEDQHKNADLELKLHINFIFICLDGKLHVALCLAFVN